MDFGKTFEAFQTISEALEGLSDMEAKSIVCMVIDLVAAANNMASVELIDELRPLIAEVNEAFGAII